MLSRCVQSFGGQAANAGWLDHLLLLVPEAFAGRYFEPFFGGGALFFRLQPDRAVIADHNAALMNAYRVVRDHPTELKQALRELPSESAAFYRVRSEKPASQIDQAARLIYLTTNGYNGIYRVNRKGEFNVPFGGRNYSLGGMGSLQTHSAALKNAEILVGDFADALADVAAGDLVYLDPPYTVAHSNNGFLKYNARVFLWSDQVRLARLAHDLSDRGATVIVSNADHESILGLYATFRSFRVPRKSVMARSPERRIRINELVFANRSLPGVRGD